MNQVITDKKIITVDSQVLNSIQECAYKTKLVFIDQVAPISKAEALESGDLVHTCLSEYYTLLKYKDRWVKNQVQHGNIVKICNDIGFWHARKLDLAVEIIEEDIFQFSEYCRFYQNDLWVPLAVEEVGTRIIYDSPILQVLYAYKVDLVAEHFQWGVMPWDHKTSKRRSEHSGLSNQFMGYTKMFGMTHFLVNKIGFQKTLKPEERFQRQILNYTEAVLEAWIDNSVWWFKFLEECIRTDNFPQNFTSCDKYNGCMFRPLCLTDPSVRQWKIERDYIQGRSWDVAKIL